MNCVILFYFTCIAGFDWVILMHKQIQAWDDKIFLPYHRKYQDWKFYVFTVSIIWHERAYYYPFSQKLALSQLNFPCRMWLVYCSLNLYRSLNRWFATTWFQTSCLYIRRFCYWMVQITKTETQLAKAYLGLYHWTEAVTLWMRFTCFFHAFLALGSAKPHPMRTCGCCFSQCFLISGSRVVFF